MFQNRERLILPVAILVAILAISTASIFIRLALGEGAPAIVIAALRLTIASLLLTPFALIKHREDIKKLSRSEIALGALAGLFLAIHFATWVTSLAHTSVASSAVFVSTGPLWVALLSPALLNEKLSRAAIFGLVLSLLGGIVVGLSDSCSGDGGFSCPGIFQSGQNGALWGNFLALAGAWAVTGYLIIGRKIRSKMALVPYIFLVYGMSALFLIIFMFASGNSPLGYTPTAYLWIFLLAAVPQLIGHSTFNWALKFMPATFVAIATLGEPIGSAILAIFILQEFPSIVTIFGGVLILIGIYLASKSTPEN